MRRIDEVVSDIKGILNNIERAEECYGENLVEINELCDEILAISCRPQKTNADRIHNMSVEELAEFLDNYRPENIANEWCLQLCPDRKDGDCDCPYGGYETALGWLKSKVKEQTDGR